MTKQSRTSKVSRGIQADILAECRGADNYRKQNFCMHALFVGGIVPHQYIKNTDVEQGACYACGYFWNFNTSTK